MLRTTHTHMHCTCRHTCTHTYTACMCIHTHMRRRMQALACRHMHGHVGHAHGGHAHADMLACVHTHTPPLAPGSMHIYYIGVAGGGTESSSKQLIFMIQKFYLTYNQTSLHLGYIRIMLLDLNISVMKS